MIDIRSDIPILNSDLIYMDNAATTQKPRQVISAVSNFYEHYNANVHRGFYELSDQATRQYEQSRQKVQKFVGANFSEEIIFTRGTTDSLNQLAYILDNNWLKADDEILVTQMEHHSNLVPWQEAAKRASAHLKMVQLTDDGYLDLDDFLHKLNKKTKILAITHVSNVLGTINPIKKIAEMAHEVGAIVVVDGAQAIPHLKVDLKDLGVDFYAFSGHKMLGPTGIGVLYGKKKWLEKFDPAVYGGEMISQVFDDYSTWAELPQKFEGGTPPIAQAVGLGSAIDYLNAIDMNQAVEYLDELSQYMMNKLSRMTGISIYGPQEMSDRIGVYSFTLEGVHPHDLATFMDEKGMAIRAGHHCAQPLMRQYQVPAMSRISPYLYNSKEEIDLVIDALSEAKEFFGAN